MKKLYNPKSPHAIRGAKAEEVVKDWLASQGIIYCHPGYTTYGPDAGDICINGTVFDVKTPMKSSYRNITSSKRKDVHIDYLIGVDYYDNILGAFDYNKVKDQPKGYDLISFNQFSVKLLLKLCNIC